VICGDDPRARALGTEFVGAGGSASFYGSGPDNDYRFEGIAMDVTGCSYRASADGRDLGMVSTGVPGIHNVYNSLAALAVGHRIGLDTGHAIEGIRAFKGVRRRYEKIGQSGGMTVIDDYAHHPTEIRAVLRMARELDPGRIVVVFQPHRYSRTKMLAAEFGESFGPADLLVVTDVYGAGEEPEPGVTGELIADAVMAAEPGKQVIYLPERSRLARGVVDLLERGDTVITMGAGDVTYCAREILEVLGPP